MICRPVIKRTYFTMEDCNIDLNTILPSDEIGSQLANLLIIRYSENWIVYADTEVVPWTDEPVVAIPQVKVNLWADRFRYIYETTKNRYIKLISLYKEQENNLLNKIGSTTTNSFNDTPQNANVGDTDEYTSTVSKTKTEIEPGEVMSRIANIYSNYKNLYNEWVKEFSPLFGENTLI